MKTFQHSKLLVNNVSALLSIFVSQYQYTPAVNRNKRKSDNRKEDDDEDVYGIEDVDINVDGVSDGDILENF